MQRGVAEWVETGDSDSYCPSSSSDLRDISKEIIQATAIPESNQQYDKPRSLDIHAGVIEPHPVSPHSEPDKAYSKGT